jgi:hypothetical protein
MRIAFPISLPRASRALNSFVVPAVVACTVAVAGCSDGNTPSDNTGGTGSGGTSSMGSGGTTAMSGVVQIKQENNYTVTTSNLTIPPVTVAEGSNVKVCWDQVKKDFQGHALAPSDIQQVSFVPVSGTQQQVGQWLNDGQLDNSKITQPGAYTLMPDAGTTCATLSQFPPPGGASGNLDPTSVLKVKDGVTYLVVFAHGKQLGFGARTMLYLVPSSSSSSSDASATADSSTMLTFKADLHDLKHVAVSASAPPIVDWSGVPNNGQNIAIDKNDISRILIGFYEGKTIQNLEDGFLNLDQLTPDLGGPTKSWQVSVKSGQTAGLVSAAGRNGEMPFASFAPTDGTWLLGMFCDGCQNPAPEIVTILDPQ